MKIQRCEDKMWFQYMKAWRWKWRCKNLRKRSEIWRCADVMQMRRYRIWRSEVWRSEGERAHMWRRCDYITYDNQLQITHEAKVKISLRPALMTMNRNSGGRLNVLSQHLLVWTKNYKARFICWILQPSPHTQNFYPSHRSPQESK